MGYAVPVTSGTRVLANFNYAIRHVEEEATIYYWDYNWRIVSKVGDELTDEIDRNALFNNGLSRLRDYPDRAERGESA